MPDIRVFQSLTVYIASDSPRNLSHAAGFPAPSLAVDVWKRLTVHCLVAMFRVFTVRGAETRGRLDQSMTYSNRSVRAESTCTCTNPLGSGPQFAGDGCR